MSDFKTIHKNFYRKKEFPFFVLAVKGFENLKSNCYMNSVFIAMLIYTLSPFYIQKENNNHWRIKLRNTQCSFINNQQDSLSYDYLELTQENEEGVFSDSANFLCNLLDRMDYSQEINYYVDGKFHKYSNITINRKNWEEFEVIGKPLYIIFTKEDVGNGEEYLPLEYSTKPSDEKNVVKYFRACVVCFRKNHYFTVVYDPFKEKHYEVNDLFVNKIIGRTPLTKKEYNKKVKEEGYIYFYYPLPEYNTFRDGLKFRSG